MCRVLPGLSSVLGLQGAAYRIRMGHSHTMCLFMLVFSNQNIEWLFDLQLDVLESSDDESCGDVFNSDNCESELMKWILVSSFLPKPS